MKLQRLFILVAVVLLPLGATRAASEAPETLIAKALREVRAFDFKNGYRLYSRALAKTGKGSELWQTAIFGKAVCALQISPPTRKLNEEASQLFRRLLAAAPKSRYATRAQMNLARIAEMIDYGGDKPDVEEARKLYQKVIDTYPDKPIAGEATLRLAATYIRTYKKKQVLKGIDILKKWLAGHADDFLATTMWQYAAEAYLRPLNDYVNSLECYAKAEALGLAEKGREGRLFWRIARMAHRLMDRYKQSGKTNRAAIYRDKAIAYYTKIIKVAPRSGKAYESQIYLKALGAPVPKIRLSERLAAIRKQPASVPAGKKVSK